MRIMTTNIKKAVTFFCFDGTSEEFSGSLLSDDPLTFDFCRKIRLNIGIENLFLFDGGNDEEE